MMIDIAERKPKADFPNSGDFSYLRGFDEGVEKTKSAMKAQAIESVKSLELKPNTKEINLAVFIKDMGLYNWIKHFFDIKEEDLQ